LQTDRALRIILSAVQPAAPLLGQTLRPLLFSLLLNLMALLTLGHVGLTVSLFADVAETFEGRE